MSMHEWFDMHEAREARTFLRSIGRARLLVTQRPIGGANFWVGTLVRLMRRTKKRAAKATIKKLAREVADDLALRAAFEAVARLDDGGKGLTAWVMGRVARPPMSKADALAARIEGRRKKSTKDEKHARQMLREWMTALARAKTGVKKWRAKVAYYDRKVVADDEE